MYMYTITAHCQCVHECKWFCVCVIWTSILIVSFVSNGCMFLVDLVAFRCTSFRGEIIFYYNTKSPIKPKYNTNKIVVLVTALCFAPGFWFSLSISSLVFDYYYFSGYDHRFVFILILLHCDGKFWHSKTTTKPTTTTTTLTASSTRCGDIEMFT